MEITSNSDPIPAVENYGITEVDVKHEGVLSDTGNDIVEFINDIDEISADPLEGQEATIPLGRQSFCC